jgi:hypothetical protein
MLRYIFMGFIKHVGKQCDSRAGKLSDKTLKNMLRCGTTAFVPREKRVRKRLSNPYPASGYWFGILS